MIEKYNNLQEYLDFEWTGIRSFFGYEFRSHKACLLASGTGYKPSQYLLVKHKTRNPNEMFGAIHKESRTHYIQGKVSPIVLVPKKTKK